MDLASKPWQGRLWQECPLNRSHSGRQAGRRVKQTSFQNISEAKARACEELTVPCRITVNVFTLLS